jgi:hypothetical protein
MSSVSVSFIEDEGGKAGGMEVELALMASFSGIG